MSQVIMFTRAIKDGAKVTAYVWDDGLSWQAVGSTARSLIVPISQQLALAPLTAQTGSIAIPYDAIHSYDWYETGQVNLNLRDGRLFYFHVKPAKNTAEYMRAFHGAYVAAAQAREARLARIAAQETPRA